MISVRMNDISSHTFITIKIEYSMNLEKIKLRHIVLPIVTVYCLGCLLPAYNTQFSVTFESENTILNDSVLGLTCLIGGVPFINDFHWAWLANLLLPFSIYFLGKGKEWITLTLTLCSLLLASQAFRLLGSTIRIGPGGHNETITSVAIGFYVWIFALLMPGLIYFKLRFFPMHFRLASNRSSRQ